MITHDCYNEHRPNPSHESRKYRHVRENTRVTHHYTKRGEIGIHPKVERQNIIEITKELYDKSYNELHIHVAFIQAL